MLGIEGNQTMDYKQLVAVTKECRTLAKSVAARNNPAVSEALSGVSAALKANKV